MDLTYHIEGDYLLPNLIVPQSPTLGKYGLLRRRYLQQHHSGLYTGMQLSGKLNRHLEEIDQKATEMVDLLTLQLAQKQGATERMKAENPMKWVGLMNNCKAQAEEVVLRELVYS